MFKDISKIIHYSEGGILSKVLKKGETGDVTLFCMAEGTELSEHTSTKEGMIYVVEGTGTFTLDSEKIGMKPGVIIFMPKNAKHSLKAGQDLSFLLILNA